MKTGHFQRFVKMWFYPDFRHFDLQIDYLNGFIKHQTPAFFGTQSVRIFKSYKMINGSAARLGRVT